MHLFKVTGLYSMKYAFQALMVAINREIGKKN